MQSTSNNEEHAMKKGVSTAALAAALMAASVSANAQPGNVGAPPDAAGSPSPLIGVWCWTMNLGQAQLEVFSVTKTSFTGRYIWIGAGAGHRGVAGNVEGNHLAFLSSSAMHYDLTLKNDVFPGEDPNTKSGNTRGAPSKQVGRKPL